MSNKHFTKIVPFMK